MSVRDLLPPLDTSPEEFQDLPAASAKADAIVYRLGLSCSPVPGFTEPFAVAGVEAEITSGPVLTQRTDVRQRHGLPLVFDKCMTQELVGEGEIILLLHIRPEGVPDDLESAFVSWRARAEAAAGLLAAVLDERVAGRQLLEDAVLLRNGSAVGGVDLRRRLRHFLPFDVTRSDRLALRALETVGTIENAPLGRAARLYRRAVAEGPTADAYLNLWVAVETLTETRQPRRADLEKVLADGGINPEGLPLHVGLLIDLRGKIVHEGVEDHERLSMAYYEMEALTRLLLRQQAGIHAGGWWPAHQPSAYASPWDDRAAAAQQRRRTEWHATSLPPTPWPGPARLPRRVPNARADSRAVLDSSIPSDAVDLIANTVVDAVEWLEPNAEPIKVILGTPPGGSGGIEVGAGGTEVWLPANRLDGLNDEEQPQVVVNLVWDVHWAIAVAVAMQTGIGSEADGAVLLDAIGAAHQYDRLIGHGEFDAALLKLPDPVNVGTVAGWAAVGDARAADAVSALRGRDAALAAAIVDALREEGLTPPRFDV